MLQRWTALFTGPLPVQRYLAGGGEGMSVVECQAVAQWAATYRERLADISWFMRVFN